jgi:hypothetical protein
MGARYGFDSCTWRERGRNAQESVIKCRYIVTLTGGWHASPAVRHRALGRVVVGG